MKLRYIILSDFQHDWNSKELSARFSRESWLIVHYMTRHIRKEKIESGSFNSIVVNLVTSRALKKPWLGADNLNVDVAFEPQEYEKRSQDPQVNELFCELMQVGFESLLDDFDLLVGRLIDLLSDFRDGGFTNEWNFKHRQFREFGLKASLDCKMDLENFTLTLTVTKGKTTLLKEDILVTHPDPLFWQDDFEDIILSGRNIEVPRRIGKWPPNLPDADAPLFSWKIPFLN